MAEPWHTESFSYKISFYVLVSDCCKMTWIITQECIPWMCLVCARNVAAQKSLRRHYLSQEGNGMKASWSPSRRHQPEQRFFSAIHCDLRSNENISAPSKRLTRRNTQNLPGRKKDEDWRLKGLSSQLLSALLGAGATELLLGTQAQI